MKYIAIFLTIVLSSCATGPEKREDELRFVFDQLRQETNTTDEHLSSYFTRNMWQVLMQTRNNPENQDNSSTGTINNFPNEIRVTGSMEAIDDWKGCLIVQGNNQQGQTMDYNITFIRAKTDWKFSNISVTLYEPGQKRWLNQPVCDTEKKRQLWFKHTQGG